MTFVAALVFTFIIRLRFPCYKSVAEIMQITFNAISAQLFLKLCSTYILITQYSQLHFKTAQNADLLPFIQ